MWENKSVCVCASGLASHVLRALPVKLKQELKIQALASIPEFYLGFLCTLIRLFNQRLKSDILQQLGPAIRSLW